MGRQQGESNTTISVADGKRASRGSIQPAEEVRIHDNCLYTDRFTAHTSSKQSNCASKMYATKAMEFDKLNKANSSGTSLTPDKQQSLEEIVSQLNYAYSILYTPTEEALPQNILIGIESMLHEMSQKCLAMRGLNKNLVNTTCRLLISYSSNINGNVNQNNQEEILKQQESFIGYQNNCGKSSQQVDLYGLCQFYLGMVEILLNRQENVSLQHLYQAKQSFEDQQLVYGNATELIDQVSSIIQHIQHQQITKASKNAQMSQSPLKVLSAQQNIINNSKDTSNLLSQQLQYQKNQTPLKQQNKNAQNSSASSHTINNHNKDNRLSRKISPEDNTNTNQIHSDKIDDSNIQAAKITRQALQLEFENLQKAWEPKQLIAFSPREENPFKSQLAKKLVKSSHPSPAFTPRSNISIPGSSTFRESNQQIFTSRLRTGRMKVSGKDIIIQKTKNGYFEKRLFNHEDLSRDNSKSSSIIKEPGNNSLLGSARKKESKKIYCPFDIPNSTNGLEMTGMPTKDPQQLRDCLNSQRKKKDKNVNSWENSNDLKQYLLKEKRYSNPQALQQDQKLAFNSQVNTRRNRNDKQQTPGDKISSSSQLYQPELQQLAAQGGGEEVQFGYSDQQQLKENNYFSYQQLEQSQGKSKFSQWKDSQKIQQTSQKHTNPNFDRQNNQKDTNMTSSDLKKYQELSNKYHKPSNIRGDIEQDQQTNRNTYFMNNSTNSYEQVLKSNDQQLQVDWKQSNQVDQLIGNNILDKSYQIDSKNEANYTTDKKYNKPQNDKLILNKSLEKQQNNINNFPNHSCIKDNNSSQENDNTNHLKYPEFNGQLKPNSSSQSRNNKNSIKKLLHPKSATLKKNSAPIVYPCKLGDQSFRKASFEASQTNTLLAPLNNTIIPSVQSYFPHQFLQETSEFNCNQNQNPQIYSNTVSVANHIADQSHKIHQQAQIIPKTSSCTSSSKRNGFNSSSYQSHQLNSSQQEQDLSKTQRHMLGTKNNSENCVLLTPKKNNSQTTAIPSKKLQKYNSTQTSYSAARATLNSQQQHPQVMQDYQINRMSNISSFHGDSSNSTQDSLCFLKKKQEISKIENLFKRKESFGESQQNIIQQMSGKRKIDESKMHRMVEEPVDEIQKGQRSQENDISGILHDKQKQQNSQQFSSKKSSGKSKISASCQDSNIYQMALKSICAFSSKLYSTPMQPELGFSQFKQQGQPQKQAKTVVKIRKSSLQKVCQLNSSQNNNLSSFIEQNSNRTNIQKNNNKACSFSSDAENLIKNEQICNQQNLLSGYDTKQAPNQSCDNNNNSICCPNKLKGFCNDNSCNPKQDILESSSSFLTATPQQNTQIQPDISQSSSVLRAFGQDQAVLYEFQFSLAKRINSKLNYLMSRINKQQNDNQMIQQALKESEELSQNSELELDLQYQGEDSSKCEDKEENNKITREMQ